MSQHAPRTARIIERIQETSDIFTLRLKYADALEQREFEFEPGQFNMLYLHGVGEVAISIISDPRDSHFIAHTIRDVGRVTHGFAALNAGDQIGIRGPFGRGWPLAEVEGKNVVIVTGGLGCAPVLSVIYYMLRRRERFGRLTILQGVKHANDLIWRERYDAWKQEPDTTVSLAADIPGSDGTLFRGTVVELFNRLDGNSDNSVALLCGPEFMNLAAIGELRARGYADESIWVSLERNMQCATGFCGHCQLGPLFVCRDGPVFRYDQIADWLGKRGF